MSLEYINGIIVDSDSFRDHSVTFGTGTIQDGKFVGKNTWSDWHLIPSSKPVVVSAGVSTNYVDIPGRLDGPIDMSEYLTGGIVYGARSGSFQFMLHPDFEFWETVRLDIVEYLHGKRMRMVLSDDPAYYYEGRFSLGDIRSEDTCTVFSINYAVGPYKYRIDADDWFWDPFNFETDRTDRMNEGRL